MTVLQDQSYRCLKWPGGGLPPAANNQVGLDKTVQLLSHFLSHLVNLMEMPKPGRRPATAPWMTSLASSVQTMSFSRPLSGGRVGIATKHPPTLMSVTDTRTGPCESCIYSSAPNLHGTRACSRRSLAGALYLSAVAGGRITASQMHFAGSMLCTPI